jgi:2-isopropylmalate synthase
MPMASVKLSINGRSGEGRQLRQRPHRRGLQHHRPADRRQSELLRFTVSALTGGTDAQGEVTVRLRENGLVALGRGSDPDIITASAKAYVNGLNRLEYLKEHPEKSEVSAATPWNEV